MHYTSRLQTFLAAKAIFMAKKKADSAAPPPPPPRINVVGIGASAGGIEALREFFAVVPDDLGLAYVVVVHLAPDHESELGPILARKTKMEVVEVREGKRAHLK